MHQELRDFLVRVMSLACGIERRQDFFTVVLLEMARAFRTDDILLLLGDPAGNRWTMVGAHPRADLPEEEGPCSDSMPRPAQAENLKPIVLTHGETGSLLLPFKHSNMPLMCIRVRWPAGEMPQWIGDEKSLVSFGEKLGSYLAWGNVLLQIAASKRHLQTIFDLIPTPVSVIGPDHTLERVNRAFVDHFKRGFDNTVGRKCFEVVHGSNAPWPECPLHEVLGGQSSRSLHLGNGTALNVTHMPMHAANGDSKVLVMFKPLEPSEKSPVSPVHTHHQFLKLYDSLSQPLTVISLIADLLLLDPRERFSTQYLEITRREIDRIMAILKDERNGFLVPRGPRQANTLKIFKKS